MRRVFPALLSVFLVAPLALEAQDSSRDGLLTPGARVRVAYAGEDARIGTLIALAPDTLTVQWANGAGTARMARTRVTRLGVSRGLRESNKASRAKVGFGVGAGLGLLIGAVSSSPNSQCGGSSACDDAVNGIATVIGAGMLGGVGAAVGAISGRGSEKWEDVPLTPPGMQVVIPSVGRSTSVGLALTF